MASTVQFTSPIFCQIQKKPCMLMPGKRLPQVEAAMQALALDTCRDVFIGSPLNRGISGARRSRASPTSRLLPTAAPSHCDMLADQAPAPAA